MKTVIVWLPNRQQDLIRRCKEALRALLPAGTSVIVRNSQAWEGERSHEPADGVCVEDLNGPIGRHYLARGAAVHSIGEVFNAFDRRSGGNEPSANDSPDPQEAPSEPEDVAGVSPVETGPESDGLGHEDSGHPDTGRHGNARGKARSRAAKRDAEA